MSDNPSQDDPPWFVAAATYLRSEYLRQWREGFEIEPVTAPDLSPAAPAPVAER